LRPEGRGEPRDQPTTGRWSRGDTDRPFGGGRPRARGEVGSPPRGPGTWRKAVPTGARGTARPAHHRPVVARRQRLPASGR